MRTYSLALFMLCLVLITLLPIPLDGQGGTYNTFSGWYWCEDRSTCLHEIGHKLDQQADWISHSPEFTQALTVFIFLEAKQTGVSPYLYNLLNTPGVLKWSGLTDRNSEIYARIFQFSDGNYENMPEFFRPFYDWELAHNLIKREKLCQR